MASINRVVSGGFFAMCAAALVMALSGCHSQSSATAPGGSGPEASKTPAVTAPTIRVKAGADQAMTDSKGITWAADSGFDGGDTVDRPDLKVTGTWTPELYRSERYSMNSYSFKVPDGPYVVKLHFSEDYDGIASPDDRKFTYAVKDGDANGKTIKEVKHFSPWGAAAAQFKAYVDTVPMVVTKGQITITFTPEEENPQINAIEILPD